MIVKYKVSDFAKDLNLSTKKVLDELTAMGSTGKKNSSNLEENELNYLLEKFSKAGSVKDLDEFLNSAKAPKEEPKPAEKKAEKKHETPGRRRTDRGARHSFRVRHERRAGDYAPSHERAHRLANADAGADRGSHTHAHPVPDARADDGGV